MWAKSKATIVISYRAQIKRSRVIVAITLYTVEFCHQSRPASFHHRPSLTPLTAHPFAHPLLKTTATNPNSGPLRAASHSTSPLPAANILARPPCATWTTATRPDELDLRALPQWTHHASFPRSCWTGRVEPMHCGRTMMEQRTRRYAIRSWRKW